MIQADKFQSKAFIYCILLIKDKSAAILLLSDLISVKCRF